MAYYPLTQGKWPPSSPFTRLAQSAAGKSLFNGFISLQLHSSSQHEFLFDISRLEIQVNTEIRYRTTFTLVMIVMILTL